MGGKVFSFLASIWQHVHSQSLRTSTSGHQQQSVCLLLQQYPKTPAAHAGRTVKTKGHVQASLQQCFII